MSPEIRDTLINIAEQLSQTSSGYYIRSQNVHNFVLQLQLLQRSNVIKDVLHLVPSCQYSWAGKYELSGAYSKTVSWLKSNHADCNKYNPVI
jgi:hypothetical protein